MDRGEARRTGSSLNSPNSPNRPEGLSAGSFAGIGLQFAVALVLFLLGGQWLDRRFDTSPAFVVAGEFLGGGAAFYSMYRRLAAAQNADDERRRTK